jgi:3,4-dihydroxy 2-butanone 4-phosphate synthase / GTP cyclohydrolase II
VNLASIPQALDSLRAGGAVIVVDRATREDEGDIVLAAEFASPERVAWMVQNSSGFLCAPMPNDIADRLELPVMVTKNEDPRATNYTVSVDTANRRSTGISASDRARTLRTLANPDSTPSSLQRPGHVVPLRAADGGVRERDGHTEAAVDLLRLAGLVPVAAIAEIVADDGEMMRLPELVAWGQRENMPVITIESLIQYMTEAQAPPSPASEALQSMRVSFEVETTIPTVYGPFAVRAYHDRVTGNKHVAMVAGPVRETGMLVRVHSECLTGEAFGSLKCECGPQLSSALETVQRDGGVVIYLRGHEGRGIGLINKLRAYRLQEQGVDTLEANLRLGLPVDDRDYGAAAAILQDLGARSIRLLTNNPDKIRQLEAHGISVEERVPLVVGVGTYNEAYLEAKRERMGHAITNSQLHQALSDSTITTELNAEDGDT